MAISGTLSDANIVKMSNAVVEIDIGSVDTWVAVESWGNAVEMDRGAATLGEEPTLDGTNHVSVGVQGSARVRATFIFTSVATDPFAQLYGLVGTNVDIRVSPTGTAAEQRLYTSSGWLLACSPPGWQSTDGSPAKFEIEIGAADILNEAISA